MKNRKYHFLLPYCIFVISSRMLTMPLWPGWTWRDALRVCKRRSPSLRRSMKRYVSVLYLQTGLSELKDCVSYTLMRQQSRSIGAACATCYECSRCIHTICPVGFKGHTLRHLSAVAVPSCHFVFWSSNSDLSEMLNWWYVEESMSAVVRLSRSLSVIERKRRRQKQCMWTVAQLFISFSREEENSWLGP